ncbi:hypothetical protein BX666DRAFT_1873538 [Dichotomocladium elegans]|nr:hypothetical protein BX666DRAFT_1873538 [Dichotomocladium elegans]
MGNNEEYIVEEDTGEWGISLEDLGESDIDDEDGDMVLEQHLTVYNKAALERLLDDFKLTDLEPLDVISVTTDKPVEIKDVYDDLSREEAFFNQALAAARHVRQQTEELGLPFLPEPGQGDLTIRDYKKKKKSSGAPQAISKRKAAAEKEENEFIDQMKLVKRKPTGKWTNLHCRAERSEGYGRLHIGRRL